MRQATEVDCDLVETELLVVAGQAHAVLDSRPMRGEIELGQVGWRHEPLHENRVGVVADLVGQDRLAVLQDQHFAVHAQFLELLRQQEGAPLRTLVRRLRATAALRARAARPAATLLLLGERAQHLAVLVGVALLARRVQHLQRMVGCEGAGVVLTVDRFELADRLNHRHQAQVVAREVAHGGVQDVDAAERRELV